MSAEWQHGKRDKLAKALADGQLWRAKEILAGRIRSGPFNAETYEQLGAVLLRMGDDLEAGRYLFLSGQRGPEYDTAITLFVRKYAHAGWKSLVAAFPAGAKRCSWSALPPRVREELQAMGVPARAEGRVLANTLRAYPAGQPGWQSCALVLLVAVALGLLLAFAVAYFH